MRTKYFLVILLVILVILLVGGNIYQYWQLTALKKELAKSTSAPLQLSEMLETVDWTNPENPMASLPLKEEEVPEEAIRLTVSLEGFSPETFEVKASQKVILALKAEDSVHIFKFRDEKLSQVAIGLAKGELKAITFYAPKETGEYEFYCDVPGHQEVGKMIVK